LKAKLDQNEYIAQPLISAREFTVDGLADNESKLVGMIPRERIITRDGLAVVTRTVDEPQITEMIKKIVSFGKLHGPFAIQYFKTLENRFLFIDVNTRFAAGGLPLSVQAGVNIPLETVKLALGKKVSINHEYKKNLTMIRYYTELFLE
jgi:carbamoyl-phosphate synthase large subunit